MFVRTNLMRCFYLTITIWVPVQSTGCASHIHNPGNHALAQKAQTQLNALIKSQDDVFHTMKANLSSMSGHESDAYKKMATLQEEIKARQVTGLNWKVLRSDLDPNNDQGLPMLFKHTVDTIAMGINQEMVDKNLLDDTSLGNLAKSELELKSAKQKLTDWNRRLAVLEKLIEITPNLTALDDVQNFDEFGGKAKGIADNAKDQTVTFLDADGNNQEGKLGKEISTLFDSDRVMLNGDTETGILLSGLRKLFNSDSPGLVVTVAALAKDLAEGERTRVLSHLDTLGKRRQLLTHAENLAEFGRKLSEKAHSVISDKTLYPDGESTMETLESLAKEPIAPLPPLPDNSNADQKALHEKEVERYERETAVLPNAYLALETYAVVAGGISMQLETVGRENAYFRHLQSIQSSQINASLYEALASRGIEGLVEYHSGGIKPEEIAEIAFKIANLAAFSFIAAGVN